MDERPTWSQRLSAERAARNWSQAQVVRALRLHAEEELPGEDSLVRQWKRWESGEARPGSFYQPIIARVFGTVTHAIFPVASPRSSGSDLVAATGMETLDIVTRLQASDVDTATLDALRITADRLAAEYPMLPSEQLLQEGRQWLRRVANMQSQRLTLTQHREMLVLAGWFALLVGCVEYDLGLQRAAESTRKAALSLGLESGDTRISGWAHEIRAWMALTRGDYRGVIAAAREGQEVARGQDVVVQLAAQKAKAWARIGDRRQVELALEEGRETLEALPYPDDLDNHFSIDPGKFDFYAMDCYRLLGEDGQATVLARQVLSTGTDFQGLESSPMRNAEARITLGVAAAREGDLEAATVHGERALGGERRSVPSLLMVSEDLTKVLQERYPKEVATTEYFDNLRNLTSQQ